MGYMARGQEGVVKVTHPAGAALGRDHGVKCDRFWNFGGSWILL